MCFFGDEPEIFGWSLMQIELHHEKIHQVNGSSYKTVHECINLDEADSEISTKIKMYIATHYVMRWKHIIPTV